VVLRSLAALALIAGCGQSLFDNNVGGGGDAGNGSGDASNMVASSCPAGCIGDAAADIDGSRTGWRYLEDPRNRTWVPMTAASDGYVGAVSPNAIQTCAANAGAAGCIALPGALLLASAGATASADPALEFTTPANQVVQVTVRVYVPSGQPGQSVRLYRNSREDVLFTAPTAAGALFERAIAVDALAGDRFVVALAPTAMGADGVAVHVYLNATGEVFPKDCQLAVDFAAATGNNVANACGAVVNYREWDDVSSTSTEVAPQLAAGPFPELGMSADIPRPRYYLGSDVLVRSGDTTTQLWVRHDAFEPSYAATAFSDLDLDDPYGGLQIVLYDASGNTMIEAATCTGLIGNQLQIAYADVEFPDDNAWHFVRVVHTNGQVRVCVDGVRLGSYALPMGKMQSAYAPRFGRNVVWLPTGAFFDGGIDDVRTFSSALPCE
jgi:hypothetical protein